MILFTGLTKADFPVKNFTGTDFVEEKDPLGSGENVFKLTLPDAHNLGITGDPRDELVTGELFAEGEEILALSDFLIPTSTSEPLGIPKITKWLNLGEMFAFPWTVSSPSPVMIWVRSGVEYFSMRRPQGKSDASTEDGPWQIPLTPLRGKWIRLIQRTKLSKNEAVGSLEWWVKIGSDPEFKVTFFKPGESYNPKGEKETDKLIYRTLHSDTSHNSAWHYPKHYRAVGQFGTGTIWQKPTIVTTTRAEIDTFIAEREGAEPPPEEEEPPPEGEPGEITVVGESQVTWGERTSLSIPRPAGIEKDDVILCFIFAENGGEKVLSTAVTSTAIGEQRKWAEARNGIFGVTHDGVTGANIVVNWVGSAKCFCEAYAVAVRGVELADIIDAVSEWLETGAGTSIASPEITTIAADALVFYYGVEVTGVTATPPAGTTELQDTEGELYAMHIAIEKKVAPGKTGTKTWTLGATSPAHNALVFSLTPAPAPEPEEEPPPPKEPPDAITVAASSVGETSAKLNGTVDAEGKPTTYWYEWGTTIAYGHLTSKLSAGEGEEDEAHPREVTGLPANTLIHFRIVAENADGKDEGSDLTFTTSAEPEEEEPPPEGPLIVISPHARNAGGFTTIPVVR